MALVKALQRLTPFWKQEVEKVILLPPLPLDYQPKIVEIFDDFGLLAGSVLGIPYDCDRKSTDVTTFLAWYLDGQLAFFSINSEIVLDRLTLMAQAAQILTLMEGS